MSAARSPESGQKARTRRALMQAAHELLRTGRPLTVTAAANVAGVSRATAYRYFPTNEAVVLHATMPLTEAPPQDPSDERGAPAELPERAARLVRERGVWAFEHETELRTLLRLSLDPERKRNIRRGNTSRGAWIDDLLRTLPARVTPAQRRRLAVALTPLFGADAVVWTTDIAELDRDEALDTLAWIARTLVRSVVTDR
ncbi:MAG TPA: hypothetical protein VH395_06905 [Jatrophihabitantaceae bacterium]|jgi:AcrR family transcriptional regulator